MWNKRLILFARFSKIFVTLSIYENIYQINILKDCYFDIQRTTEVALYATGSW